MKFRRVLGLNLLVTAVLLLVLFVLLEVSARVYLHYLADDDKFRKYASLRQVQARDLATGTLYRKYMHHRYIGYIPTPNWTKNENYHNSLGFRGEEIPIPKPDGEYRIVCMGGSTTYTARVQDPKLSYPAQLEAYLRQEGYNARVINCGAEGWTSYETLANLEFRLLELDPDLIVVYHGFNDLYMRLVWPPEAYDGDNSGAFAPAVSEIFMPPIVEYSTLIRAVLIRTGWSDPHTALHRAHHSYSPTFYGFEYRDQLLDGTYPSGIFQEVPAREMVETNRPVHFRRNLLNIAHLAKANGIGVVFASFAVCPQPPEPPILSNEETAFGFDEHNAIVRQVSKETASHYYDFAAEFPSTAMYFRDECHLNAQGAALKGRLFGQYIRRNVLVPPDRAKADGVS